MRSRSAGLLLGLAACLLAAVPTRAHGVHASYWSGPAMTVQFRHDDRTPLAGALCEVRAPGEEELFQSGRTDRLGRCVFQPDRAGTWWVRAWTEDGHGAAVAVEVDTSLLTGAAVTPPAGRLGRTVTGVAVLFGIFGLVSLVLARRRA